MPFIRHLPAVCSQKVPQVNGMDSGAGPLVQRGLIPDPKVDLPIERALFVHERVQHDVAVALVELAMGNVVDLIRVEVLNLPYGQTRELANVLFKEL